MGLSLKQWQLFHTAQKSCSLVGSLYSTASGTDWACKQKREAEKQQQTHVISKSKTKNILVSGEELVRCEWGLPACGTWGHKTFQCSDGPHGGQGWRHTSRTHKPQPGSTVSPSKSSMYTCGGLDQQTPLSNLAATQTQTHTQTLTLTQDWFFTLTSPRYASVLPWISFPSDFGLPGTSQRSSLGASLRCLPGRDQCGTLTFHARWSLPDHHCRSQMLAIHRSWPQPLSIRMPRRRLAAQILPLCQQCSGTVHHFSHGPSGTKSIWTAHSDCRFLSAHTSSSSLPALPNPWTPSFGLHPPQQG